jgi:cell volume regulation protein A
VVALIMILFDGGMQIGWRRFRTSAASIVGLGILGTFLTAGLLAVAAHALLGVSWPVAAILAAALAPTDPAVLFSVLGNHEVGGQSGTILEGESGANDPVGIALMLAVIAYVNAESPDLLGPTATFGLQLVVGGAIGVGGGLVLRRTMQRISLPSESLYPLRTLAAAGAIYGLASIAHGSGFLAVFIAGVLVGDSRAPYKGDVVRFHGALAGIAEIVVFAGLGLTVDLGAVTRQGAWLDGILLAVVLVVVIRPVVVLPLLARARLVRGERLFVACFGLKGAVPILLAAFAVNAGTSGAGRVYAIVFVVVLVSVVVQGISVAPVARRLGVRLDERRSGTVHCIVQPGSAAVGATIRDLPVDADTWISTIIRDGVAIEPRGSTVIRAGDHVHVLSERDDVSVLRRLTSAP